MTETGIAQAVGVDLGHDECRMAATKSNGEVAIVLNRLNEPATPCAVARRNGEWVVGQQALDLAGSQPSAVILDPLGGLAVGEPVSREGMSIPPEEALVALLGRLHDDAAYRLGARPDRCVFAVPAYVTSGCKQRVADIAQQAGWVAPTVVDSPVAAAVASRKALPARDRLLLMVVDWGNSDCTVSLLSAEGTEFSILGLEASTTAGAVRFHDALTAHARDVVRRQFEVDADQQPRFMAHLRAAVRKVVRELNTQDSACLLVIGALKGKDGAVLDLELDISREQFDGMIRPVISQGVALVDRVLQAAGVDMTQVDGVVLVNSGATVPLICTEIDRKVGQGKLLRGVNPEDCIAFGAACLASQGATAVEDIAPLAREDEIAASPPEDAPATEHPEMAVESAQPAAPAASAHEPQAPQEQAEAPAEEVAAEIAQPSGEPEGEAAEALSAPAAPSEPAPAAEPMAEATPQYEPAAAEPEPAAPAPPVPVPAPEAQAAPAPQPPAQFGRYRIASVLFREVGFTCYLAQDVSANRHVRLRAYPAQEERARRAFMRALTAGHFNSPYVERIIDLGTYDCSLFIVSDGQDRMSLWELFRGSGKAQPLPLQQALEIGIGLLEALSVVNGCGIFHRNVKPENILVALQANLVSLAGFELCTLLSPGRRIRSIVGALPYTAPEVFLGQADTRADLYSAAAVLYEMLTGTVPFHDEDAERTRARILTEPPPAAASVNRSVPRALSALITRGLEKDPSRRMLLPYDLQRFLQKNRAKG
jgi:hypothetical protein